MKDKCLSIFVIVILLMCPVVLFADPPSSSFHLQPTGVIKSLNFSGPAAPVLGSTACYTLFTSNGAVNDSGGTYVTGDVGTNSGVVSGYNALHVTGLIHLTPDGSTATCAADLLKVYNYLGSLPFDTQLANPLQFGNKLVLIPATYYLSAATTLSDTLFLDAGGDIDGVFVIQVNGALATSLYAKVILRNGAQPKNVFWKVEGAVDLNNYTDFEGTIVSNGAITLRSGSKLKGRALTISGAVTTSATSAVMPAGCPTNPAGGLHFRTINSGNWNNVSNWQSSSDSLTWEPAIIFPGYMSESITVRNAHTITITTDISADQLTVDNGGVLTVNSGIVLTVHNGVGWDIVLNGTLTGAGSMIVQSDAGGTASVGASAGSITIISTVERYIPIDGHRAWRLVSVPVSGTQSIKDSWQEGGSTAPNYGTLITSNRYNGTNGFDTYSANPSMLIHDQGGLSAPSWTTIPLDNTNIPLDSRSAYMLFVRGDRSATPANAIHTATTLRSTGNLRTGVQLPIRISAAGSGYTLVGNPFASPIDFEMIHATSNLDSYQVWDANLGGVYGVGGYRSVDRTAAGTYEITPATASTFDESNSMRYLHSGQGFFLKAFGTDAMISFDESFKAKQTAFINPFRQLDDQQQLIVNLETRHADNTFTIRDGIRVRFSPSFEAGVSREDVIKISNTTENLSSRREGSLLIVEQRPGLQPGDTIHFNLTNTTVKAYRFYISAINLPQNVLALLVDRYTLKETYVNLSVDEFFNFNVDADPASSAPDRFMLVFRAPATLAVTPLSLKAYLEGNRIGVVWKVTQETGVSNYKVEKSVNGSVFTVIATIPVTGNYLNNVSYRWNDEKVSTGYNVYRIHSTLLNGTSNYSEVVSIKGATKVSSFKVFPLPSTGPVLNIEFLNQPRGIYVIRLYNVKSQAMLTTQITHNGSSSTEQIYLPKNMSRGNYLLEILTPGKTRHSIQIVR